MRMRGKKPIITYKDTWNLDQSVFIPVIVESLKKYRAIESDYKGVPSKFLLNINGTSRFKNEVNECTRWDNTVDFIISSLEASEPEHNGTINWNDKPEKMPDGSMTVLVPDDWEGWNQFKKDMDKWAMNRRRAVDLFSMYFFDFWW